MASEQVLLQLDNVHISSHLPIPKPPIDIEHIHHRAHEVSQRWHTEQRCSYQHVGETFETEQSWHQSPNNRVMDLNIEWSTWESRTEPIRPVVGSSSSSNPWEEPIYNYPTVGHDDDVYRPQFDYPQPSTYGQSMGVVV
ncbi:hypothetical protein V6N12_053473 [Hibiscus sabdariffa]|uniref:Uncharacterized protein n=1 Tax=Hibiscus sabdariffa TaxID=183260 RepID=A0ABR2D7Q8_9ROSI